MRWEPPECDFRPTVRSSILPVPPLMPSCCAVAAASRASWWRRPRSSARSSRPGGSSRRRHPALARQLAPWMQQLFQDAKEIRAQHLANLGGVSYGSQVRRLLGEEAARRPDTAGRRRAARAVGRALADRRGTVDLESHPAQGAGTGAGTGQACAASPGACHRRGPGGGAGRLAPGAPRWCCACRPIPYAIRRVWLAGAAAVQPAAGWCILARAPRARRPGRTCPASSASAHCSGCCRRIRRCAAARSSARAAPAPKRRCCASLGANASHPHSWEDLAAFSLV